MQNSDSRMLIKQLKKALGMQCSNRNNYKQVITSACACLGESIAYIRFNVLSLLVKQHPSVIYFYDTKIQRHDCLDGVSLLFEWQSVCSQVEWKASIGFWGDGVGVGEGVINEDDDQFYCV